MIADLDFSGASLTMGPELVRDGGSIIIHIEVEQIALIVRYAGGFTDILSGNDGKLELWGLDSDSLQSVLIGPSDLRGWNTFVNANQTEISPHKAEFLGKFVIPQEKRAAIIEAFTQRK